MYKRFVLGALIVVLSTSAAVATAALLEVKSEAGIFFQQLLGHPRTSRARWTASTPAARRRS